MVLHLNSIATVMALLEVDRMRCMRASRYPGHPDLLIDGIGYRFSSNNAMVVVLMLIGHADIPRVVEYRGSHYEVLSLQLSSYPQDTDTFLVPRHILAIQGNSFSNTGIMNLLFEPDPALRELEGFHSCPIIRVTIPHSVELIGPRAFARCHALEVVEFSGGSRIRAIYGFQETGLRKMVFPASLEVIAPNAFEGSCALWMMHFPEHSHIRSLFIDAVRLLELPDSDESMRLNSIFSRPQIFINYPTRYLARNRRYSSCRLQYPNPIT
jgi:hypothetical protein